MATPDEIQRNVLEQWGRESARKQRENHPERVVPTAIACAVFILVVFVTIILAIVGVIHGAPAQPPPR